jgi:acetolactate synthase-1/2/3 large subunit
VLAVGLDPVELLSGSWPLPCPTASLRSVGALAARLEPAPGIPVERIAAWRETALESLRLHPGELTGWRVVETLTEVVPSATTFTVDAGAHMFPATMFVRPSGPRRFLISNGLATMGFAVPAAIGASLARPGELVVALTGDGGLAYHVAELETAARAGARIVVVVFNDASLSLIRIKHRGDRAALDFTPSDFARIAAGFGFAARRVETQPELRAALAEAVARDSGTLVDVRLSGAEYAATLKAIRG